MMVVSTEIRLHRCDPELRGGRPEVVGRHNALPRWGEIVTTDPGDYVGRHRIEEEP